jgi:tetratricopeptide (TPR) repeat protein
VLLADTLAASSSFTWTLPEQAEGRIDIKVSATDRAGNTGRYVADWLRVRGNNATSTRTATRADNRGRVLPAGVSEPDDSAAEHSDTAADHRPAQPPLDSPKPRVESTALLGVLDRADRDAVEASSRTASEAKKRYDLGTWHRLRGEHAVAIARFREALELDPKLVAARNDLAGLLYLQGDYEAAQKELQQVLVDQPRHIPALKSLALVRASLRNYRSAEETLQKLLLLAPEDADAWLYLGDVRMFMGDRAAAREAWLSAAEFDEVSGEVKERARKRLEMYPAL